MIYARRLLIVAIFLLVPSFVSAIDMTKGLEESPENWSAQNQFLKGGANLYIAKAEEYPPALFSKVPNVGASLDCQIKTSKDTYNAGDEFKASLNIKNTGYNPPVRSLLQNKNIDKLFYIWAKGNLFVQIVRVSDQVEYGEYEVVSWKQLKEDNIQLTSGEARSLDVQWKIPENLPSGTYEIRIFPTASGIIFRGFPYNYRSPLKETFKINNNDKSKEEKVDWDLSRIQIDGKGFKIKHGIIYLDINSDHKASIPLKNNSGEIKNLTVTKQIQGGSPLPFGNLDDEQKEVITLNPNEEKTIEYNISRDKLANAQSGIVMGFTDNNNNQKNTINQDFASGLPGEENVVLPAWVVGQVNTLISGVGIRTTNPSFSPSRGNDLNYFAEINREDPLYYSSGQLKRGEGNNFKLDLKVLAPDGSVINEAGYDGPFWDRSGEIFKTITFAHDYSSLKLVATLETQKGTKETKEIVYNFPAGSKGANVSQNKIGGAMKAISNNKPLVIIIILILVAAIAAIIIFVRKRDRGNSAEDPNKHDLKIDQK